MSDIPMLAAVVIAFVLTSVLGLWLVPFLRRIKYGQTILDIGPKWHKNKQGTPTMGGILFAIGISAGILAGFVLLLSGVGGSLYSHALLDNMRIILGLLMALAFGMIGFIDDYIKVVKKRNLGLSARQKLIMQFVVSAVYILGLFLSGDTSTIVVIPFFGQLNVGMLYYPAAILGITYMINVVNFTDGIDGLCASITFVVSLGFMTMAAILRSEGMNMFAAAVAGGSMGFLLWNFYPAKVFMGDTGSMFLGGCVVAMAFGLGIPIFLILMGIIYIIEGLSVIIQTCYFKITRRRTGTGKRLFKMSPIHHHFEMCGWSESKIVLVFSIAQLLCCGVAALAAYQMYY